MSMEPPDLPPEKGQSAKRQLIHDLQTFLWQFEQGGYSKETMNDVLKKLKQALESDGHQIGGELEGHLKKLIRDCEAYAEGKGDPKQVIQDLDQLRRDLES